MAPTRTADAAVDAVEEHPVDEEVLTTLELALGVVVRHLTLPRTWSRIAAAVDPTLTGSIDRSAYPLLGRIGRQGPLRLSDLADQMGVQLSTISRQVAELEKHGLVVRTVHPADRRSVTLELSERGEAVRASLRDARHRLLQERLAGWSPAELAELAELLSRFAASIAPELCDDLSDIDRSRTEAGRSSTEAGR